MACDGAAATPGSQSIASSPMGPAAKSLRILCFLIDTCCRASLGGGRPAGNAPDMDTAEARNAGAGAAASSARCCTSSKQHKLLLEYSPPTGKHMVQLLARFEKFVRLLPSAAAAAQPNEEADLNCTLQAALTDVCLAVCDRLTNQVTNNAGPHSPEQQQLYSLLLRLLKLQLTNFLWLKWANPNLEAYLLYTCVWPVCTMSTTFGNLPQQRTDAGSQPGNEGCLSRSRSR